MPNGKKGDNPISDLLSWGYHPFPSDMEDMIRRLYAIKPESLNSLGVAPFDWEQGKNLEAGRTQLKRLLGDEES